jgi:hypothetical protein
MTSDAIDESQRKAAKVAGFLYLFAMAASIFAQAYVRGRLIVPDDAVKTAGNLIASERLFRLAIALDVVTAASDVALIGALYIILRPVNQNLALVGAFFRLVETAILGMTALNGIVALRLLSGVKYLHAVAPDQLQALARLALNLNGAGLNIGFAFLGLGAAVFAYVLLKSRYVPRALAALGILAYGVMVAYSFAIILAPSVGTALDLIPFAPAFVFEVGCGLWFLVKGIRVPAAG